MPGRAAHAGIGWIQDPASGCGLFIELHDDDAPRLEDDLHATLESMRSYRNRRYGPVQTAIASRHCVDRAVCALVVAVYACQPW